MNAQQFAHYRTGIPEIDAEHWWLVHLTSSLASVHDTVEIGYLLDRLRTTWAEHVATEEDFMRSIGFPYLEAHVADHRMVSQIIETLCGLSGRNGAITTVQWKAGNLEEAIRGHIDHYDMQYVSYVR